MGFPHLKRFLCIIVAQLLKFYHNQISICVVSQQLTHHLHCLFIYILINDNHRDLYIFTVLFVY